MKIRGSNRLKPCSKCSKKASPMIEMKIKTETAQLVTQWLCAKCCELILKQWSSK